MTFEVAAELTQLQQIACREQPGFRPCGVKERGGVALRQNEAVVVVKMRIFRVVAHVTEKQRGHQVRRRAAGSGMTAACRGRGSDGMDPQLVCDALQKFDVGFNHKV